MEINDNFLGFIVVVRTGTTIHSGDTYAEPKARRAMEVGPRPNTLFAPAPSIASVC